MPGDAAPAGQPARAGHGRPWSALSRAGHLEYDRVLFFSDAVFAIAITLLIVDIRVPATGTIEAGAQIRNALPQILGFIISFAVIGMFWMLQHATFRHIIAMDARLIGLNLLFLGTIAFLPYPTALLSATSDQAPAVILYASCAAATGVTECLVWLHAIRTPGLVHPDTSPATRRYVLLRMTRGPVVFLLSIPLAIQNPGIAPYSWLLIWVVGLVLRRTLGRRAGAGPDEPVQADMG